MGAWLRVPGFGLSEFRAQDRAYCRNHEIEVEKKWKMKWTGDFTWGIMRVVDKTPGTVFIKQQATSWGA